MKSLKDYTEKQLKIMLIKTGIYSLLLPFIASASFRYLPLWISVPTGIISAIAFVVFLVTFFVIANRYTEVKV